MQCPLCDAKMEVLDTKTSKNNKSVIIRKYLCPECVTKFETTEKINYGKLNRHVLDRLHDKMDGHGIRKSGFNLYV